MHTVGPALARALSFRYRRIDRKIQSIQTVCRCFLVNTQSITATARELRPYGKAR